MAEGAPVLRSRVEGHTVSARVGPLSIEEPPVPDGGARPCRMYDEPLRGLVRERRSGPFRMVRHEGGRFLIEPSDYLGIVVQIMSQRSSIRIGDRSPKDNSRPASVTVLVPGERFDIDIQGHSVSAQLMVSAARLEAVWMEDHEVDASVDDVEPAADDDDPLLVRMILEGGAPGAYNISEAVRSVATHLLGRVRDRRSTAAERRGHRGGLPCSRLSRVRDFVEANLTNDVTLEAMAEVACMSPFHFARAFRATTNMSGYRYVLEQRLRKAVDLLCRSEMPVGEVAVNSGFAHASHLGRYLRRQMGVSGRELRQLTRC